MHSLMLWITRWSSEWSMALGSRLITHMTDIFAILQYLTITRMDRPVKHEWANYEELRYTTFLCQMCRGQIMKNCDGPWAIILANYPRQAKWFISQVIMNNDNSHTHTQWPSLQGREWTNQVITVKKVPHKKFLIDITLTRNVFIQMADELWSPDEFTTLIILAEHNRHVTG